MHGGDQSPAINSPYNKYRKQMSFGSPSTGQFYKYIYMCTEPISHTVSRRGPQDSLQVQLACEEGHHEPRRVHVGGQGVHKSWCSARSTRWWRHVTNAARTAWLWGREVSQGSEEDGVIAPSSSRHHSRLPVRERKIEWRWFVASGQGCWLA